MVCGVTGGLGDGGVCELGLSIYGGFKVCGSSVYGSFEIVQSVVYFCFCCKL